MCSLLITYFKNIQTRECIDILVQVLFFRKSFVSIRPIGQFRDILVLGGGTKMSEQEKIRLTSFSTKAG
jgi:hypothetical protein